MSLTILLVSRPGLWYFRDAMTKGNSKGKKPPSDIPTDMGPTADNWPDIEEIRVARASQIWSYDDTGFDLSIEEQLFIRSYIIDRNEVAALKRLNYAGDNASLKRRAQAFLKNPEVAGAVEHLARRMMEHLEITAEKVQRRIAEVAFFDPRQVATWDEHQVTLLNSRFWTEAQARNVQSIKMGQNGPEIKFYDSMKAAEMLAKQLQLMPEEDTAAAAAAAKAGAEAVFDKIMDLFDKTVEPDEEIRRITYDEAISGTLQ